MKEAHVAEWKRETVSKLKDLIKSYNTIAILDMTGLPSYQLQKTKMKLTDSFIIMARLRLIKRALQETKEIKPGINELENHLKNVPALIFTNQDPFRLTKILLKNKTPAKAKPGQIAPYDITIPKGPTQFTPGPVISEFGQLGIKTIVQAGKITVKEDVVIVKKGQPISNKVAAMLTKLNIEPMETSLNLVAAYEKGKIYQKDVINVDEKEYINKIKKIHNEAFNLSLNINYPTKENVSLMIKKAYLDSLNLSKKLNIQVTQDITKLQEQIKQKEIQQEKKQEEKHIKDIVGKKKEIEFKPIDDKLYKEYSEKAQEILKEVQDKKIKKEKPKIKKEEKYNKGPKVEDLIGK